MPEQSLVVTAAYGRSYNTEKEALTDWNEGKDFKIVDGPYMSKRDSDDNPDLHVTLVFGGTKPQSVVVA